MDSVLIFALVVIIILLRILRQQKAVIASLQHDPVTGLPFERAAVERIVRLVGRESKRFTKRVAVAVFFTDACRLREVNTRCGQSGGDVYLKAHADHLRAVVRPGDVVFRYGGGSRSDELIAVLVMSPEAFVMMQGHRIDRIITALHSRSVSIITKGGEAEDFPMRPHVGVAWRKFYPASADDAEQQLKELMAEADKNMKKEAN